METTELIKDYDKDEFNLKRYDPLFDEEKDIISLKPESWTVKVEERSRNRMKVQIKLNAEEAVSFKNFVQALKPEKMSEQDFCKALFLMGIESANNKLTEEIRKAVIAKKSELEASGIKIDTDGDIPVIKSFPAPDETITDEGQEDDS